MNKTKIELTKEQAKKCNNTLKCKNYNYLVGNYECSDAEDVPCCDIEDEKAEIKTKIEYGNLILADCPLKKWYNLAELEALLKKNEEFQRAAWNLKQGYFGSESLQSKIKLLKEYSIKVAKLVEEIQTEIIQEEKRL